MKRTRLWSRNVPNHGFILALVPPDILVNMNIHPLFVHFPIALFMLYSLLELIAYAWPRLKQQSWLFAVKAFLLFTGVLAAFATLVTGGLAEDLVQGSNPRAFIIEVHAPFAGVTTLLYILIAGAYLVRIFDERGWGDRLVGQNAFLTRLWNFKKRFWYGVLNSWILPVMALMGLIGITITGALGAAIVYGPQIDPFVSFVYHLFWVK